MKRAFALSLLVILLVLGMLVMSKLLPLDVVVGQSMEPAFHQGDLVYVKPTVPVEIKIGDVVVFKRYYLGDELAIRVVHRVVAIESDRSGLWLTTRGDSNADNDSAVNAADIEGVVRARVPGLCWLLVASDSSYAQAIYILFVVVAATAITVIIISYLPKYRAQLGEELRKLVLGDKYTESLKRQDELESRVKELETSLAEARKKLDVLDGKSNGKDR